MGFDDLCARCLHGRDVRAGRSTFLLCRRAQTDPRFAKYPRRPCRECPGFEPQPAPRPPEGPHPPPSSP